VTDLDFEDRLRSQMHNDFDPMLAESHAETRIRAAILHRIAANAVKRSGPDRTEQRRLAPLMVAGLVVVLFAGTLAVAFGLRYRTTPGGNPSPSNAPAITFPLKPSSVTSPTPQGVPATISYVDPDSVTFSDPHNGWVIGRGCDAQSRCEVSVARTSDGGATWSLVSPPVDPGAINNQLSITAASAVNAWAWGSSNTGGILKETHDGGHSWSQSTNFAGDLVTSVVIADGTVWAVLDCQPASTTSCGVRIMSSPVSGGPWKHIPGELPAAVQGPPLRGPGQAVGQLVRSQTRAWYVAFNTANPGLVRSDDQGSSWQSLPFPCQPSNQQVTLSASSDQSLMLVCSSLYGGGEAPKQVWSSTDGGASWLLRSRSGNYTPSQSAVGQLVGQGYPTSLDVLDQNTAWMSLQLEDDFVTHDGGVTWARASLPANPFSNASGGFQVSFIDSLHGWTAAGTGLWSTVDGGLTWNYQPVLGKDPSLSATP